jgi:flagellar biosynthesis/type III secretory pathway protein FliH
LALGRQQARQEAHAAIRDQMATLQALIESVNQAWVEERARMHEALADFAFVATNRLLGDSLRDPSIALEAVRSALNACGAWQTLTLELHPHDAQRLGAALQADAALKERSLRVVASAEVRVGGCRITSGEGTLDARLEFQLAQLRARLDAHADFQDGSPAS